MSTSRDRRIPSVRGPLIAGVVGFVVLLGGFGTWAATTKIAGAIVAPGRVVVDRNRQVVQHPEGGVVATLAVRDGDRVQEGDLLVRLDGAELNSALAIAEAELFELLARRGRLEAERVGRDSIVFDPLLQDAAETRPDLVALMQVQRDLLQARAATAVQEVRQLRKQRSQVIDQIAGIGAERISVTAQQALIGRELEGQQSLLAQGLTPAARVLALQRESVRLEGQGGALAAAVARAHGRITEIDIDILKRETRRREEAVAALSDQSYRELELLEERSALMLRLSRLEIRAPVEGVVLELAVHGPGAVLRPAQPALYLVPQTRPLVIEAALNPAQIDRVYAGQPATLRFPALDQRLAPALEGQLRRLSADAVLNDATGQSYFKAEVVLAASELAGLPGEVTLIPGMPVEVFLRTGDRAPLSYLLRPLTDYFTHALRE